MKTALGVVMIIFSFSTISFAQLDDVLSPSLSCVKEGIKNATGNKVEPSDRWIALVAVAAQEFYGPFTQNSGSVADYKEAKRIKDSNGATLTARELNRMKLQERVISMIQTYGFCSALPRKAGETGFSNVASKNDLHDIRPFILSSNRNTFSKFEKAKQKELLAIMGMKDPGLLTKNVQPLRDLFEYKKDWWGSSTQDRGHDFIQQVDYLVNRATPSPTEPGAPSQMMSSSVSFSDDANGKGLKECLGQIDSLHKSNPIFKKGTATYSENSYNFCLHMATACGIQGKDFCAVNGGSAPSTNPAQGSTGGTAGDFFGSPSAK